MNNTEKFDHWLDIAEYDLETAEAMLLSGRYLYVVFMCQQAVEKFVKGLHILYTGKEANRTHNIARVFKDIFDNPDNKNLVNDRDFDKIADGYMEFFAELLYYYISERYPTYKRKISSTISEEKARSVIDKTMEVFVWLKSLSQYKL